MGPRELSVVLPALDEAACIATSVRAVRDYLERAFERYEVIIVDDGSTDGTAEAVEPLLERGRVRLLRLDEHRGKGAAVRAGVLATRLAYVYFSDADLSMPIEEVEALWSELGHADVVIASKRCAGAEIDYPPLRRIGSSLGQALVGTLVLRGIRDTQCGFKLFRGDVARTLFAHQRADGFGFDFEVLFLARRFGHRIVEVPFHGHHRLEGSVSAGSYLRTLGEALGVAGRRALGRYPLPGPPRDG